MSSNVVFAWLEWPLNDFPGCNLSRLFLLDQQSFQNYLYFTRNRLIWKDITDYKLFIYFESRSREYSDSRKIFLIAV